MRKAKQIISTILAALMVFSVTGCHLASEPDTTPTTQPSVTEPLLPTTPATEPADNVAPTTETIPDESEPPATDPDLNTTEPAVAPTEPAVTEPTETNPSATDPEETEPVETEPPVTEPVHQHSYTGKVTAPSCESEGYATYTCSCGDSYVSDKTASTGHSYGEWETTKDPTEAATGTAERKCSACGDVEIKTLGKLNPTHKHSYTSRVTKDATCSADGVKAYTCSCGDSYTEVIAKLGHNYKDTVVTPTCTNDGYTEHTCSRCNDAYSDNRVSATGHSYSSAVTQEASCITEGVVTYTCSCGNSYTESIGMTDHNYVVLESVEAVCNMAAYTSYSCTGCGDWYWEWGDPPTGHDYSITASADPTCTTDGYSVYTCSKCSESYTETIPGGHSWVHTHTDEVGHYEDHLLICTCGWTCKESEATTAGYEVSEYWSIYHVDTFDIDEQFNHSYTTDGLDWVVDIPAYDEWKCSICGEVTLTEP